MSFRNSFSKVREKVKRELSKIGDKLGREGPDVGDKEFDRSALSLQSGPVSIVVEGEAREEDSKTGGEDNSVPRSVVERGHDLGETSQGNPHPLPHVEVESVSGQEGGDRANSPRADVGNRTPIPFISSQDGESEGMWATPFQRLPLTDDIYVGNLPAPGHGPGDFATPKDESNRESTAISAAKLFLRTVERASDAFPPLKSIAGGLCAILDSCEVWSAFACSIRDAYCSPSKRRSTSGR